MPVTVADSALATIFEELHIEVLHNKGSAKALTDALNRKLGRDINLTVSEDKSLIGGVVIRAGDLVIDGSVKGYLGELATHLTH